MPGILSVDQKMFNQEKIDNENWDYGVGGFIFLYFYF